MDTKSRIEEKLTAEFAPQFLSVVNESHMHSVPKDSQTHFKVVLVSDAFANKGLVACHRMVYQALSDEMQGGVHALALHTYTPKEWHARRQEGAPDSPLCRGGGTKN